ncbi:CIC11C00000002467 [Sungouiella intermedia]|uniref:Mitochondrial glycine transporter n=1 Tax=Sungouiella intermedia TaxID=45354 RepID=A0A1L0B6C7_9ASCO|nr:CIC11C00000002467 [[Candida] intermedia]
MDNGPPPAGTPARKIPTTRVHLISGATAGLVSAFTLQPLDLLKTRLQQQQLEVAGYRTSIGKELKKLTNVKDLWRGVLPSTLRTSVGAGLYFTMLSQTRTYLATLKKNRGELTLSILPKLSHAENLATGFFVRAAVGVITMPITVVKTRFESSIYSYNSLYESFDGIYRDGSPNGSFRHFFKGTFATLARDCPYAGLYVLFYEAFKNDLFPIVFAPLQSEAYFASLNNSTSAVLAASVSTTITAPFDAIKTRLQLNSATTRAPTLVSVAQKLLQEPGGVKNLFSGLSLRLGRKGLSAGISWCMYEELLKFL